MVNVDDSGDNWLFLPMMFSAKCAKIACGEEEICITDCLTGYVYNKKITLKNFSDIPGIFHITLEVSVSQFNVLYCIDNRRKESPKAQ